MTTTTPFELAGALRSALRAAGIHPDIAAGILDDSDYIAAMAPNLAPTLADPRTRRSVCGECSTGVATKSSRALA